MAGKYLAPRAPGCRPKGGDPIREKRRTIITVFLAVLFFLLALGLTVYPIFSSRYNEVHQSQIHTEYREAVQALPDAAIPEARTKAQAYNEELWSSIVRHGSYSKDSVTSAVEEYAQLLDLTGTGTMGYVHIDQVINALREDSQYGGILADRNSLSDVCRQSTTPKFGRDESGFRVNTQDYAYLLRLNPSPGDYNFCVYCYKRDYLDRNMRNAEHGIRFITPSYKEKFRIADGDSIRITFSSGETHDRPCRYVDETHLEVGNNLYHICEFAERMQHGGILVIPLRQSLPEKCFSALEATGEIITVTKGEKGYTPTGQYPQNGVSPKEAAAALNEAAGVTKAQEAAMVAGSMFGWDTPAADPKNYDAKGVPIKNHRERDAR